MFDLYVIEFSVTVVPLIMTIIRSIKIEHDYPISLSLFDNVQDLVDRLFGNTDIDDNNDMVTGEGQIIPYGIDMIGARSENNIYHGKNIKVAVIDTGIDHTHPDLIANVKGGINIINGTFNYMDDNNHGTHVAGAIGALNNNVGVGYKIELYGVKVLYTDGSGYTSALQEAVDTAKNNNIICVCAAGNSGLPIKEYPASYESCLSIAALDKNKKKASFSTYNNAVDFIAPGVNILSTISNKKYDYLDGTSMASPHVAGIIATLLSAKKSLTFDQIKSILIESSEDIGATKNEQGNGLINIRRGSELI